MWDITKEPARGGYAPAGFVDLPGIERARARAQGLIPRSPVERLFGTRLTHASVGAATVVMPASPWLVKGHDLGTGAQPPVDLLPLVISALTAVAQTTSPAGTTNSVHVLGLHFVRRPTVASESFVARARTIAAGPSRVTAEAHVEDVEGRLVAHGTGQVRIAPSPFVEHGSPPVLERVTEPSYATSDPHALPLDDRSGVPLIRFLGAHVDEVDAGSAKLSIRPNDWLNSGLRIVSPSALHVVLSGAVYLAAGMAAAESGRFGLIEHWIHFGFTAGSSRTPHPSQIRGYIARARITVHNDEAIYTSGELTTDDGHHLLTAGSSSTIVTMPATEADVSRDRVLAAVLQTDIVASTPHAERLGDARWKDLLEDFRGRSSKQIASFRGREVKWTGDGVLATFDSPARAVQCARGIRDAARALQIEIRAGVHVGECELMGADVAGIAVHVANRVMDAAEPGSIYVTSTVREASAGSGLRYADQGTRALKGVEGEWHVYAVAD